ncbi:restriction endonuclease subunit S [Pseudarthrobacter sp. S3]|uniref:restriction endonuclease subunit S n=1 Tax=Pseudarthrobacter sp. S3 TaxID=3418419 RepID=UPI003CF935C6
MVEPVETQLGDVCCIIMGQAPPGDTYSATEGLPLIAGAGDFANGLLSPKKFTSKPTKLSEVHDIVISIRASIGDKVWADGEYCLGRGVAALRPGALLDRGYLWHWLDHAEPALRSKAKGATFLQVNRGDISTMPISLPSINDQRRIAAILDKADGLRTKRRQALAHLDTLTQSIFHSMFGGISATTTLGELCRNRFRNGVSPSTRGSVQQKVLTLSAVTGSSFDGTAVKSSTFDKPLPDSNRVSSGLLLICRGNGNRALVGKGYFPRADIADVGFPDTVIAAEPNMEVVEPFFLEVAWGLPEVRAQLEAAAKTTNGTFKINQTSLTEIQLPLPSLELQQTFATRIAAVERLKENHRKHLTELDTLFASLQHRAFKGEL